MITVFVKLSRICIHFWSPEINPYREVAASTYTSMPALIVYQFTSANFILCATSNCNTVYECLWFKSLELKCWNNPYWKVAASASTTIPLINCYKLTCAKITIDTIIPLEVKFHNVYSDISISKARTTLMEFKSTIPTHVSSHILVSGNLIYLQS